MSNPQASTILESDRRKADADRRHLMIVRLKKAGDNRDADLYLRTLIEGVDDPDVRAIAAKVRGMLFVG